MNRNNTNYRFWSATAIVLLGISIFFSSCEYRKRVHNRGYSIEKIFTQNESSTNATTVGEKTLKESK